MKPKKIKKWIFPTLFVVGLIFALITVYRYAVERNFDIGGATFSLIFLLSPLTRKLSLPLGAGMSLK